MDMNNEAGKVPKSIIIEELSNRIEYQGCPRKYEGTFVHVMYCTIHHTRRVSNIIQQRPTCTLVTLSRLEVSALPTSLPMICTF